MLGDEDELISSSSLIAGDRDVKPQDIPFHLLAGDWSRGLNPRDPRSCRPNREGRHPPAAAL
ncbi:hypothetical protein EYF80_065004 [Liparis tanakae]|uniref:Uncharacterized protein n=1 Tax=Liparis tanakae TaxID=230148 RepID=A0A4Z2E8H6_9TELE|nr:hypothetical protein EYF80_065004 [Liparis tanakae]